MMQWERKQVQEQIAFAEKTTAAKIIYELELFFAGETLRKGYEYEKVKRKLQELRQKYELEEKIAMFSDMHEEWEHRLVEKTKRETAQKFYDLSEEWGGGVTFYKKARALAKQCGVEVE